MGDLNFIFAYRSLNFLRENLMSFLPQTKEKKSPSTEKKISECILKCFRQLRGLTTDIRLCLTP